jgi:hypothetical protein
MTGSEGAMLADPAGAMVAGYGCSVAIGHSPSIFTLMIIKGNRPLLAVSALR